MRGLLCGVLDLGNGPEPGDAVTVMAAHLAAPFQGHVSVATDGPLALAQISPQPQDVLHSDAGLLAGDLGLVWTDSAAPGQISLHTIAEGFARRGEKAAEGLDGEYGFAHWLPQRHRLILVRDRVGTRSIYYAHKPSEWFAFASLPGALLTAGFVAARSDRLVVSKLVIGNFAQGRRTPLADVSRVLPAHTLTLETAAPEQRRYWSLVARAPISPRADPRDVVAEAREHLDRAVQRRLPAEGPAFSHLSGGLDSSSVAAVAADLLASQQRRVRAYGFYPNDTGGLRIWVDETPEIEAAAAAQPNIDLVRLRGWMNEHVMTAPMAPGLPFFNDPGHNYALTLADAKAHGAVTVLAGYGGDQGISYNGRGGYAEMLARGRWGNMLRIARERSPLEGREPWRIIARDVRSYLMPDWMVGLVSRRRGRRKAGPGLSYVLQPDLVEAATADALRDRPDTRAMLIAGLEWGHITHVLEEAAWWGAQYGVQFSSPLLDRDLLEYVIRVPPECFTIEGHTRALLRLSTEGRLADQTRLRPSKLVPDPFEPLRMCVARDQLLADAETLRGTAAEEIVQIDLVRQIIAMFPAPSAYAAQVDRFATAGRQYACPGMVGVVPLIAARFAAGNPPAES